MVNFRYSIGQDWDGLWEFNESVQLCVLTQWPMTMNRLVTENSRLLQMLRLRLEIWHHSEKGRVNRWWPKPNIEKACAHHPQFCHKQQRRTISHRIAKSYVKSQDITLKTFLMIHHFETYFSSFSWTKSNHSTLQFWKFSYQFSMILNNLYKVSEQHFLLNCNNHFCVLQIFIFQWLFVLGIFVVSTSCCSGFTLRPFFKIMVRIIYVKSSNRQYFKSIGGINLSYNTGPKLLEDY